MYAFNHLFVSDDDCSADEHMNYSLRELIRFRKRRSIYDLIGIEYSYISICAYAEATFVFHSSQS
jgi:hypothetical protein